jgi:hypothetical protein
MKKTLLVLLLFLSLNRFTWADSDEIPNFSLMFHSGGEMTTGFIPGYQPAFEGGAWMGAGLSDRWDGFFAIDYYTMPNVALTISGPASFILSNATNAAATTIVQPTDDVSLSINTRWYPFNNKWDYAHRRYNTSLYLLAGMGLDLVVDIAPSTTTSTGTTTIAQQLPVLTDGYDILFGMNFGAGIDFPIGNGREVSLYTEALDHMIFWQGLTQVFDGRFGIRFMLDTAHVDPFR